FPSTVTTSVKYNDWGISYASRSVNNVSSVYVGFYFYINDKSLPCLPSKSYDTGVEFRIYAISMQILIDDLSDPANNFHINLSYDCETGQAPYTYPWFAMEGGVQKY